MASQEVHAASSPDPIPASKFAITVSNTDFAIAAGVHRFAYDPNGKVSGQMVDYSTLLIVSPIAAKQLAVILMDSVEKYEKSFGPIAVDERLQRYVEDAPVKSPKTGHSKSVSQVVSRSRAAGKTAKPSTKS